MRPHGEKQCLERLNHTKFQIAEDTVCDRAEMARMPGRRKFHILSDLWCKLRGYQRGILKSMDENLGRAYLIEKLREHGLSRRRSLRVLNHIFREIDRALARGEEVEFAGGRLVKLDPAALSRSNYDEQNWPAHWPNWKAVWVPTWERLKQLVGPEEAEARRSDFWFDAAFSKEWFRDYCAKRRREKELRKLSRGRLGKGRKKTVLTGK